MGTRKKLKQVAERVDKIAKVINSSQANVMYQNGFILGAVSGGGGGSYTAGNGIDITNNVISVNTDTGIEDANLTGDAQAENITVSGDLTLTKGADFTAGADAEVNIECDCEISGSQFTVADTTVVTGLIKSLGNEAVSGDPYHFTYYQDVAINNGAVTVTNYTITLDNNKTLRQYPATFNIFTSITGYDATKTQTLKNNHGALEWVTDGSTTSYPITTTVTNGSYTGDTSITSTATVTIAPNSSYYLPSTITVTGATYTYNSTTGVISLSNPTGNVTISATCTATEEWWSDTYINSLTSADVGTTKEVMVNGVSHTIRLIGIDKDTIAGTSTKAHTTWEFVDLISDSNGYSLASYWKNTNDTSTANFDYLNSDIRKAIDGQGSGTANWFVKSGTTWESTLSGKSVLNDMLPANLVAKLKTVSKTVNINSGSAWTETSYDTKLFLLSPKEMGYDSTYMETGVTTYDYYTSSTSQTDAKRIKAQQQGSTGALTNYTTVTSGAYSGTKYSYAGYNSSTSGEGGVYWLRSPSTSDTSRAWNVSYTGYVGYGRVYYYAYGVSPCFCL